MNGQKVAQITKSDIEAENGVIHVIDSILLPPPGTSSGATALVTSITILLLAVMMHSFK